MNLDDERGESPSATSIADDYPEGVKSPVASSKRLCRPKVIPDAVYPGMFRVQWPDGRVSDLANMTRINDAIACFMESAERRQRQSRKWGASPQ